jgi:activator of Hsp90 ATPase-like protein
MHPRFHGAQRREIRRAVMHAAVDGTPHQPRPLEHADVPGNGRQRHRERPGELGHLGGAPGETREQRPARAMAEGVEQQVESIVRRGLVVAGGQTTTLDRSAGGAFSLFGARIKGRNVELVPNARIVEAWRSEGWEAGVYSIVRFELKAEGTGTRLVFDHTGFPLGQADHLAGGWKSNYWDRLTSFLAGA